MLASGQFLMTLDSSVMNVSMATVAADLGTTITGIQTAITLYTLVMATLMITGGKLGTIMGRRRAMGIGLVIYAAGSFTTAIAPNLTVLLIGWSLLEGIGAALIMPAIVALVASNFAGRETCRRLRNGRRRRCGGGGGRAADRRRGDHLRLLAVRLHRRGGHRAGHPRGAAQDRATSPPEPGRIDLFGSLLSVVGLGLFVFGVLRSSEWGWVIPKAGRADLPERLAHHLVHRDRAAGRLRVPALGGPARGRRRRTTRTHCSRWCGPACCATGSSPVGSGMFFSQFMIQAGAFFAVPLFLSVVLGLNAMQTGVRLVPLSIALLLTAIGIPKVWPKANPRRVVRIGLLADCCVGIGFLVAGMDPDADAAVMNIPMLLMGLGLGALASQLGAVTVSAVSEKETAEVGGLQNTATNLGASHGHRADRVGADRHAEHAWR